MYTYTPVCIHVDTYACIYAENANQPRRRQRCRRSKYPPLAAALTASGWWWRAEP